MIFIHGFLKINSFKNPVAATAYKNSVSQKKKKIRRRKRHVQSPVTNPYV